MMPKKLVLPSSSSPSTERAKAFRDRLEKTSVTRWEIFANEATKNRVRDIARLENLTAGVAAEALLELGIEAYVAGMASSASVPLTKSAGTASKQAGGHQSALKWISSKSLGSYSTRSSPSTSTSTSTSHSSAALRDFFVRVKSKRP
jgi:hypothetical protein